MKLIFTWGERMCGNVFIHSPLVFVILIPPDLSSAKQQKINNVLVHRTALILSRCYPLKFTSKLKFFLINLKTAEMKIDIIGGTGK